MTGVNSCQLLTAQFIQPTSQLLPSDVGWQPNSFNQHHNSADPTSDHRPIHSTEPDSHVRLACHHAKRVQQTHQNGADGQSQIYMRPAKYTHRENKRVPSQAGGLTHLFPVSGVCCVGLRARSYGPVSRGRGSRNVGLRARCYFLVIPPVGSGLRRRTGEFLVLHAVGFCRLRCYFLAFDGMCCVGLC